MANGKISNITAIVGSNSVGKTTLLSFLANNSCKPINTEKSNNQGNEAAI